MITIATITPAVASDRDLRALHAIAESIALETDAGATEEFDVMVQQFRETPTATRGLLRWLARDGSGAPVGSASLLWPRAADRHHAGFGVDVLPPFRRRGLGTRLLSAVLEAAARENRTFMKTWVVDGGLGEAFLPVFGGHVGSRMRKCELDLASVDRALLTSWMARASERASAYSLVEWEGLTPPQLRVDLARVKDAMETAPTDDLVVEPHSHTADELEQDERRAIDAGWRRRVVAARQDATGTVVAYTEITFPPGSVAVHQGDTVVEPTHRNRGIGRWLKAAMLLSILDEWPHASRVRTDNASSNDAMLSINDALGFRTVRANGIWQLPVESAREIARARLERAQSAFDA